VSSEKEKPRSNEAPSPAIGLGVSESPPIEALETIDLEQGSAINLVLGRTFEHGENCCEEFAVPNCCAICLESYSVGETVVWSMNSQCNHLYHQSCIANFFAHSKKKKRSCVCPTCRREFFAPNCDRDEQNEERQA
jgi:hypothetical protein